MLPYDTTLVFCTFNNNNLFDPGAMLGSELYEWAQPVRDFHVFQQRLHILTQFLAHHEKNIILFWRGNTVTRTTRTNLRNIHCNTETSLCFHSITMKWHHEKNVNKKNKLWKSFSLCSKHQVKRLWFIFLKKRLLNKDVKINRNCFNIGSKINTQKMKRQMINKWIITFLLLWKS